MDLKMNVYSPALELLGILEVQRSVIWETRAFSSGSFSTESLITDESRSLLVLENIIWIEGEMAGIIEYVQRQAGADGPYITAKGRDLTGILDRRILWGQYDLYGPVPDLMRRLVDDCCIHPTRGDLKARVIPGALPWRTPPPPPAKRSASSRLAGPFWRPWRSWGRRTRWPLASASIRRSPGLSSGPATAWTAPRGRRSTSRSSTPRSWTTCSPATTPNDSLDDYDYGEEDSEEWETEEEESDEPDADGGSAEEDDGDSVK